MPHLSSAPSRSPRRQAAERGSPQLQAPGTPLRLLYGLMADPVLARAHADRLAQRASEAAGGGLPGRRGRGAAARRASRSRSRCEDWILQPDGSDVATVGELSGTVLRGLFENRVCGVRVPNFCSPALCRRLSRWMTNLHFRRWGDESNGAYDADMYWGVGLPATLIQTSRANCERYFEGALPAMRRLRAAAGATLSPIDKLRLELDEVWPQGAQLNAVHGWKMFTGLGRLMQPKGLKDGLARTEGIIHVDAPFTGDARRGGFSANIYLRVPTEGGELAIWNVMPTREELTQNSEFYRSFNFTFSDPSVQATIRARLPPPKILKPQVGELIILNSGRPHAVRGFRRGTRLTIQSFISYERNQRLRLHA